MMAPVQALYPLLLALGGSVSQPCVALREYDAITSVVTDKFYDRTFRSLNWPSRVAAYRKRVACGADAKSVARVVNALLSELHASHTGVYTADQLDYWALESIFSGNLDAFKINVSGIWPGLEEGHWYARYVLPGSPAEAAGVRLGDALISLNGRAFDPIGFSAAPNTLTVSSDGHARRTIRITPMTESIQQSFVDAIRHSTTAMKVGAARIGYFHLWAGTHPAFLQLLGSALQQFEAQRVDGLIIDLRGGYGGASLDYLQGLKSSAYLQGIPKIALIDDGVRSGKEWVAAVIKHDKIATLVGSRTAGAFLGGFANHLFDDKYFLYVAGAEFIPPDIGRIEGLGVEPDIAVPACRKLCNGNDPQLQRALALMAQQLESRRPSAG